MSTRGSYRGKGAAFWVELALSVTAMAVCGCICLTAFLKSDAMGRESRAKNQALMVAQSVAEHIKLAEKPMENLEVRYFNAAWNTVQSESGAAYRMTLSPKLVDNLESVELAVEQIDGGNKLCDLNVQKYRPSGTAD